MVEENAVQWFIKNDAGDMTSEERAEFELWLAERPEHRATYEDVQAIWSDMGQLHVDVSVLRPRGAYSPPWHRRKATRHAAGLSALAACLALVFVFEIPLRLQADELSGVGEIRKVTLQDGSTIHLNANSAIAIDYTDQARTIRLLKGEGVFDVAKNPARPFQVKAGGGVVTALGTSFVVRLRAHSTDVTVLESKVNVTYSYNNAASEQILKPTEKVSYGENTDLNNISHINLRSVATWRQGQLTYRAIPLRDVVADINRYYRGHVQIVGLDVGKQKLNGVFDLSRPGSFIDTMIKTMGLKAVRLTDGLIFLYD